jgi:hypothetical protein
LERLDLIGDLSILQGKTWNTVIFMEEENLVDWAFRGQIKNKYGGRVLADLAFLSVIYGTIAMPDKTFTGTTLEISLSAAITANIPKNSFLTVTGKRVKYYFWEVEAEKDGVVLSIVPPSLVEVFAEIVI